MTTKVVFANGEPVSIEHLDPEDCEDVVIEVLDSGKYRSKLKPAKQRKNQKRMKVWQNKINREMR